MRHTFGGELATRFPDRHARSFYVKLLSAIAVFLVLGTNIVGCAAQQEFMAGVMSSWQGAHITEVIARWGPPHEEISAGGLKYYTWHYSNGACDRSLGVDESDQVVTWNWSGNNCPVTDGGVSTWRR